MGGNKSKLSAFLCFTVVHKLKDPPKELKRSRYCRAGSSFDLLGVQAVTDYIGRCLTEVLLLFMGLWINLTVMLLTILFSATRLHWTVLKKNGQWCTDKCSIKTLMQFLILPKQKILRGKLVLGYGREW